MLLIFNRNDRFVKDLHLNLQFFFLHNFIYLTCNRRLIIIIGNKQSPSAAAYRWKFS